RGKRADVLHDAVARRSMAADGKDELYRFEHIDDGRVGGSADGHRRKSRIGEVSESDRAQYQASLLASQIVLPRLRRLAPAASSEARALLHIRNGFGDFRIVAAAVVLTAVPIGSVRNEYRRGTGNLRQRVLECRRKIRRAEHW